MFVTDRRLLHSPDVSHAELHHVDFRHISEVGQGKDYPVWIVLILFGLGIAVFAFPVAYLPRDYLYDSVVALGLGLLGVLAGGGLFVAGVRRSRRSRLFVKLTVVGREEPLCFFNLEEPFIRELQRAIVAERDQAAAATSAAAAASATAEGIQQLAVSKHEAIQRLADLYASGYITREQFERERQKFLDLA